MTANDPNTAETEGSGTLRQQADALGLSWIDRVDDGMLDPELVADIPVEWARTHVVLPVRMDARLCLLTAAPGDISAQEELGLLIEGELEPVLAPRAVILQAIERCYYRRDASPGAFLKNLEDEGASVHATVTGGDDLLSEAERAPAAKLVNLVLLEAVKRGASDVHVEPLEARLRVRYRIDGVLYEQSTPPKHLERALVSRLKVMAHMDIAETRLPQDGMARVRVGEREIDIRVSTVPVAEGERVVLRLLDRDAALLPLDVLGMQPDMLQRVLSLLQRPHGMIAVAGPTGSGKTTTLYAALGRMDSARRNILTIEDPIEYQLPNIGQIQVKPKIGLTFANGLRHILRQDPDIVLVGETRDIETADIAIRASLTGHLVFTTLHTNDAPGAVLRLLDMGIEPYLLASCLRGVLAQRLVRCLCPVCREAYRADAPEADRLGGSERLRGAEVWRPGGCDACLEGYAGRTALFELMEISAGVREVIRAGHGDEEELRRAALQSGMRPLVEAGIDQILAGVTDVAEVAAVISS